MNQNRKFLRRKEDMEWINGFYITYQMELQI